MKGCSFDRDEGEEGRNKLQSTLLLSSELLLLLPVGRTRSQSREEGVTQSAGPQGRRT